MSNFKLSLMLPILLFNITRVQLYLKIWYKIPLSNSRFQKYFKHYSKPSLAVKIKELCYLNFRFICDLENSKNEWNISTG